MTCNANMIFEDNRHNPQSIFSDGVRCEIDGAAVKTWSYEPYGKDGGIIHVRFIDGGYTSYKIDGADYMDKCSIDARELTTIEALRILYAINVYGK